MPRKYGSDEYEFYAQDSWKIGSSLTVTAGVRYSLFSPPWEVNGQQVAPTSTWALCSRSARRTWLAGIPDNTLPLITFDLAGPANGKPGLLRVGQEQLRAALRGGLVAARRRRASSAG